MSRWTKINVCNIVVTAIFLILHLVSSLSVQCWDLRLVTVTLACLTALIKISSLVIKVKSGAFTSKTFLFFWTLMSVIYTVNVIRDNAIKQGYDLYVPIHGVTLALSLVLLLSQWFPYQAGDNGEEQASFLSILLFSWLDYLFIKGFRNTIEYEEIPKLPRILNVENIIINFKGYYKENLRGFKKILLPLFHCFGGKFIMGSILRAVNDIFLFLSPLILRKLLSVMEQGDDVTQGYFWCVMLLLTAATQAVISAQYFRFMYQAGFQMRAAVMSTIFRKSLRLSSGARQQYSGGEITNLFSIDAQRIIEVLPNVNVVWSAPFQIILALYFLYDIVGNSAFAGMAILLTLVPANVLGSYFGKKIQTSQMKFKDQRMLKINEILKGIKAIKYYAWEKPFMALVNKIRDSEIRTIRQHAVVYSMLNVTFTVVPLAVTLGTFSVYIHSDPENHVLTVEKVFSCIAIFNVLRVPLFLFPLFFNDAIKLMVSLRRISKFLDCSELETKYIEQDQKEKSSFQYNNASFQWNDESEDVQNKSVLQNISLDAKKGELIAVIGKVGSGKSSLLASLMGEMSCQAGGIKINSRSWAYVSQQAWIQNMTVKDNILFGSHGTNEHYNKVIDACALTPDLKILPGGDKTEIGENGVNLSGGQKQRIALARAAYRGADVYLLDDPLSAVDAHVAKHLFSNLIGPEGILRDTTRVLVTHNLSFLDKMDSIVLIDAGKIILQGSFQCLKSNETFKEFTQSTLQSKQNIVSTSENEEKPLETKSEGVKEEMPTQNITEKEKRQEGRVSLKNYSYYVKLINTWVFLMIISLYALGEGLMVGCNLVLAQWTDQVALKRLTLEEHHYFILIYGGLNLCVCCISVVYNIWSYFAMTKPSRKMHKSVLERTMHAPLSFFEANPSGRILNRFTSDIEVVDRKIPFEMADMIYCTMNFIAVCITISAIVPYILIALVPIGVGYILLQMLMSRTRCQIKRHESVAKSPIISHFSEAIAGATTIRAFGETGRFQEEFEQKMGTHLRVNYINDMMNRWLSIRVEILGNILVFLVAVITFTLRDSLSPGMAGIAITYSMMVLDSLGWNIRMVCEMETDSVAIERIREYEEIEQEQAWEVDDVPEDWPRTGELRVEDVSARYRPGLPDCLSDLRLSLRPGEKLGVCGRTGAGKSSLANLLLRVIQPRQGRVSLGGRDTSTVGLQQLRAKVTIVPQVTLALKSILALDNLCHFTGLCDV